MPPINLYIISMLAVHLAFKENITFFGKQLLEWIHMCAALQVSSALWLLRIYPIFLISREIIIYSDTNDHWKYLVSLESAKISSSD